jgi:predicted negative regulator of RcsB-dependent stress response
MTATLGKILAAVMVANQKLDVLMSQSDDLSADVQAIDQAVTDLGTAAAAIEAEIAALKNANPALDLSGLDSAVASLKASVSSVAAIPSA